MAVGTAVADTLTVPAKKLGPMGNALLGGWLYDALPGNEMFTRYTPVAANLHETPTVSTPACHWPVQGASP